MNEQARLNIPEWSVSELSAALKKTVEDAYGYVRVRGEISGYRGPHSLRPLLFRPQGRRRQDRGGDLEGRLRPHAHQARGRARGDRDRPAHHLSGPVEIPDRGRDAGARRRRRADGAAGRAQEEAHRRRPVRSGAQAAPAVPAGRDRRHHLADRRRHPRHPAPARRPVSAPRHRLAGARAGRGAPPPRSRPRSTASTRCPPRAASRGPT